jgi:hypothetical protein
MKGARGSDLRVNLRVRIEFEMLRPKPFSEEPIIAHRRDTQVVLSISIITEPEKAALPWSYIRLPDFNPMIQSSIRSGQTTLDLVLEVHGATTGTAFVSACPQCSTRASSTSPNFSLFNFIAKDGLVEIQGNKARVAFLFLCFPGHHRTTDTEYR